MSTAAEKLQTQQDLAEHPDDVIVEHIRSALMNVHTSMPGVIESCNVVQNTVKIRPAIKRLTVKGESIAIGLCRDVPMLFPGGALTFDVNSGDDALIVFSERCIDNWWSLGGVQEPAEIRFHDLSDGFAIVGFNSLTHLLTNIGSGTEIRLRDGSVRVALRNGKVLLGSATASGDELSGMVNGVVLAESIDTLTELPRWMLGGTSWNVLAKR